MEEINIKKGSNLVNVMVAQAKNERVDSAVAENAANLIRDLASDPNPNNRYQIGQLIAYAVTEINKPRTNWLDSLADVKRVGYGEKAQFRTRMNGIRAFIQAKGATTARTKVADKTVILDTVSVSARPVINYVTLKNGTVNMADLIREASYQMELAEYGYIQNVLDTAAATWSSPYYGTGSGIVTATLNPMIQHWMRVSGGAAPSIIGDIAIISKLAAQTGFTATTNTQWVDGIINEQNQMGYIGVYNGARVVNLLNPVQDNDAVTFGKDKLYIIPGAIDASMRPLKVVFEGDVDAQEQTNIDDKSYEVRLDQFFGAGIAFGDRPYMSVYDDSTL